MSSLHPSRSIVRIRETSEIHASRASWRPFARFVPILVAWCLLVAWSDAPSARAQAPVSRVELAGGGGPSVHSTSTGLRLVAQALLDPLDASGEYRVALAAPTASGDVSPELLRQVQHELLSAVRDAIGLRNITIVVAESSEIARAVSLVNSPEYDPQSQPIVGRLQAATHRISVTVSVADGVVSAFGDLTELERGAVPSAIPTTRFCAPEHGLFGGRCLTEAQQADETRGRRMRRAILFGASGALVATSIGSGVYWANRQHEVDRCASACGNAAALEHQRNGALALTVVSGVLGLGALGVGFALPAPQREATTASLELRVAGTSVSLSGRF